MGLALLAPQLSSADPYITIAQGSSEITSNDFFEKGTSYKYGLGGIATENLKLEVNFLYLGEFENRCDCNSSISISGIEYAVIGEFPINPQTAITFKGGLYKWSLDNELFGITFEDVDDSTSLSLGIGAIFYVGENVGFTIAYDQYDDISGGDISNLMLGMNFKL